MAQASSEKDELAIGIDLGTTFSCVAVVHNGKVEILRNQGSPTTSSYVAFNEYECMVGDTAKGQMGGNSANTIFDAKRLIGRKFDDPIVQKDMKQWPFKVVNVNGMPKIEVTFKGEVKLFSAEEISAMILGTMKDIAESYLNAEVTNAVVTVPAYFNDMQRKATKDAAAIAGLKVTRIINEPTAAAIAYGMKYDTKVAKNVLVYDLGGGTFDVTILNICENVFEVKATAGDTHLGGEDFDNRLMEKLTADLKQEGVDILSDERALRRLRTKCERAKRDLTWNTQTRFEILAIYDGYDYVVKLSRAQFYRLCDDLFRTTITIVESALADANLTSDDIDTIVLVGGSTRIPRIQELLRERFPGKEINRTIDEDTAVAYGAAIQAAIIHGGAPDEMKKMTLKEVTPLTLGTSINCPKVMDPIIKRNTSIPVTIVKEYITLYHKQTEMSIDILQGERHFAKDNFCIGEFVISGIPPRRAGVEEVAVTFSTDENGILSVSAESKSNCRVRGEITIRNVFGSLTKTEIEQMTADAKEYREQDREMKEVRTARAELENYCIDLNLHGNRTVSAKCDEVLSWLKTCNRPEIAQFSERKKELDAIVQLDKQNPIESDEDSYLKSFEAMALIADQSSIV